MATQEEYDALTELDLDPLNPRLRDEEEGLPQDRLIAVMLERFRIDEVAESVIVSGWLDNDPLMATIEYDDERGEDRVRVLEGNRRLTAVKLLLDPQLAPVDRRERWSDFAERLPRETRSQIARLTVRMFESRNDPAVASYIGYRHVAGVLPWQPKEKAEYVNRLVGLGLSYTEIADRLGSYPSHMRRHHLAFGLVRQAESQAVPGANRMGDAFGVLLRSLQTEGIPDFIGIEQSDDPSRNVEPVPADHMPQFADFVAWTFGTETEQPVLPESRELTNWGRILSSPVAVAYLERAEPKKFDRAWLLSGGEAESLADSLWRASYSLADAVPLIDAHLDDVQVIAAARECLRFLAQISDHVARSPVPLSADTPAAGPSRPAIPGFTEDEE